MTVKDLIEDLNFILSLNPQHSFSSSDDNKKDEAFREVKLKSKLLFPNDIGEFYERKIDNK